ncbi:MAG: YkuS family protein [Clostridia bacterium]|nr:YkuS family protein [Clostridia bacterium]
MKNKRIAVEHNLTPVMELLQEKGYSVEDIDLSAELSKNIDQYDALIVTGMNKDFLGVHDVVSKIPVINAEGLTANEIYDQLTNKFQQ